MYIIFCRISKRIFQIRGITVKKSMLDIIFASGKRKNALLFLLDGPKEMETILSSLETSRPAILPQLRILEDHYLISHYSDTYELTKLGEMVVGKMLPFVLTSEILDQTMDFFASHNTDPIPPHLFKRIKEIRSSEIIEPDLADIFELNKDFIEKAYTSSSAFFLSTFTHSAFPAILAKLVELDVSVTMLISNELLDKFKSELYEEFKHFHTCGKVKFYLCKKDIELTSLSICDHCFALRLLSKKNRFSSQYLFCSGPEGYKWSRDLLDHYLKDSELITEV